MPDNGSSSSRRDIVLATLNAKFIHASFGLRYLLANLGDLRSRARLIEFDIRERPLDIAERLLACEPRIVGLGVYIWNAVQTTEVVAALKRVRPGLIVILGGPEVSHETGSQPIVELADYVIAGEADLEFARVCRDLLDSAGARPSRKVVAAPLPALEDVVLPYEEYDDRDVAHRVVYVEASRGCPFTCEFCLSSLEVPVRQVPLDRFLEAMRRLMGRGVRHFKFVDRTFNLNLRVSRALLEFFLDRHVPGRSYHFEMIPDRLPEALREVIARFPPATLQFEVGIQSFNDEVCALISRRQDTARLEDNFHYLARHTGVHIHADLIAGLPGEDWESFGRGFDRLVALGPQEIQVGILKRLRGTPIVRHDAAWGMVYSPVPPYEVLQTRLIPFEAMQRLRRFARYWDLISNSGNFGRSRRLLWTPAARESGGTISPFHAFMAWSDWLFERAGRTHAIALARLAELLFEYLTGSLGHDGPGTAETIWGDFRAAGRTEKPAFLRPYIPDGREENVAARNPGKQPGWKRQSRHTVGP